MSISKRILSIFFKLVLLVGIIASTSLTASAASQSDAIKWCESKGGTLVEYNDTNNMYQCFDFVSSYAYNVFGYKNFGTGLLYARNLSYYNPGKGWVRISGTNNLKPGDVFVQTSGLYGHTGVIISVNNDNETVTVIDQNNSGNDIYGNGTKVIKNGNIYYKVAKHTIAFSKIWGVIRPPIYVKISFNATGGTVSPASKSVSRYSTIGTLPTPKRAGYTFTGWYTAKSGGVKISNTTKVSTVNVTYYAHWKEAMQDVTSSYKNKRINISFSENGLYLSYENRNKGSMYARATIASSWECFNIIGTSDGWIGIKAENGKYISNVDSKGNLKATASTLRSWECFKIYKKGAYFYIKSQKNGKYLSARVNENKAPVRAQATIPSTWERISIKIR